MARPRGRSDPTATRARIIAAATAQLASEGYAGASLARIAREAGMSAPALLYHFPSKEALFEEVLRSAWQSIGEQIAPVLERELSAEEMLGAALVEMAQVVERSASMFTQINATLLSGSGIGAAAVNDTLLPVIRGIEDAVRSRAPGVPPGAPIRQAILYLILAHTAHSQLAHFAPAEAELVLDAEPGFAQALLHRALAAPS